MSTGGGGRYLPTDLADWLRRATLTLADPQQRAEVAALVEHAFHTGHEVGFDRGHADGAADVRATADPDRDPAWATPGLGVPELRAALTAPAHALTEDGPR